MIARIPQCGDKVCVSTGEPREGVLIAREFFHDKSAWGFAITLHYDGGVSVGACSRRWPDVIANTQLFIWRGDPLSSLALARDKHLSVRDQAHGGLFDLGQVTQDLLAQWAIIQQERAT